MIRAAILGVALATAVGTAPAQPPRPQPAPALTGLEGWWFMSGDPFQPCYIQSIPGPWGPYLILTNEKGDRSRGRLLLEGRRIIADDWGKLVGDVYGNRIEWRNGTDWYR
jgi:hypothetical protein